MNSYEKAQQLLSLIEASALSLEPDYVLPSERYARVGTAVVACEGVQVAALDMNPDGFDQGATSIVCDAIQLATFACIIARDCSATMNEDGSDNVAAVGEMSSQAAQDAQFLWEFAQDYDPFLSKNFNVGWTITGGILITTLSLTTGID